jgi:phosphopantetheinyl transferase
MGRNALKQVLSALSLDVDTCVISFPSAQLSLSHSGDIAFAAGTSAAALGIGIDFERPRRISAKAAPFYLTAREITWVEGRIDRNAELLRLWTVKEAAYKSYPGNTGKMLKDFTILDPSRPVSEATVNGESARIRIATETCADGFIAVAVVPRSRTGKAG